jgi:predicted MFS family arabinose efflux permease
LSFVAFGFGGTSLVALAVGLIVFDLGVQGTHISNQTIVYALRPEARSRLNSAYMTVYFLGGATGSGLSALLYASHGWAGVCVVGAAFPTVGLALWLVDTARRRSRAQPVETAG